MEGWVLYDDDILLLPSMTTTQTYRLSLNTLSALQEASSQRGCYNLTIIVEIFFFFFNPFVCLHASHEFCDEHIYMHIIRLRLFVFMTAVGVSPWMFFFVSFSCTYIGVYVVLFLAVLFFFFFSRVLRLLNVVKTNSSKKWRQKLPDAKTSFAWAMRMSNPAARTLIESTNIINVMARVDDPRGGCCVQVFVHVSCVCVCLFYSAVEENMYICTKRVHSKRLRDYGEILIYPPLSWWWFLLYRNIDACVCIFEARCVCVCVYVSNGIAERVHVVFFLSEGKCRMQHGVSLRDDFIRPLLLLYCTWSDSRIAIKRNTKCYGATESIDSGCEHPPNLRTVQGFAVILRAVSEAR